MKTHNPSQKDLVFVRELFIKAITGVDAWHRPQPQPVLVSIWLHTDVAEAGSTDHLTYSLNYDVISRNVTRNIESGKFRSLEQIASNVAEVVLADSTGGQWATIHVKKPRALLRAESSEIIISRRKVSTADGGYKIVTTPGTTDVVKIHKLQLVTIIGVNTIERLHRQNVILDLTLYKPTLEGSHTSTANAVAADADSTVASLSQDNNGTGSAPTPTATFNKHYDFRQVVDTVSNHVEDSSYKTVEAFVTSVAKVICKTCGVEKATVRAEKPSAITFAEAAGVEITRTRDSFTDDEPEPLESDNIAGTNASSVAASAAGTTTPRSIPASGTATPLFPQSGTETLSVADAIHNVYLAFGSNEGDPIANIEQSRHELAKRNINVIATSSLYLSEPMFVADQNKFYNGVFHCQTKLAPLDLLDSIKDIESNALGRVKLMDNGPRTIDLDILLYDDLVMNHPRLNIPHIGMLSRSFVLQPLVELVPSDALHPLTAETYRAHLDQIPSTSDVQSSSQLVTCIPLPHSAGNLEYDPVNHTRSTDIMAIINVTPDSFSDGGKVNLDNIVETACTFVKQGAKILDVGGMSTNPKSVDPGSAEELSRIVPAIKALRACPDLAHIPISIDTYRSEVAEAALEAGANIINDISAGVLDPVILEVAVKYKCPIILNHTRGSPQEMTKLAHYSIPDSQVKDDSDEAVVEIVGRELEDRVNDCVSAGLARWQIILDPGLGFAKNINHNLAIIRNLELLRSREAFTGLVWLLGPSRKRFIGTITGRQEAADRILGTAATVTSLIAGGSDIVRVHDVPEMADVVKMADAIHRNVY
ncbi:trifunctional dihydropteroate synthetase/dihydrohydroxymethylpterin pyrophosphokinase/dihydroneopterin aldolase FOL1 [Sugiyamaella lignohabitans]|uniref:Folic acid synthesis protein FOL1 n=1 Tax=Sugiyamaella lignohabitans TaxID=796027 RepID=A0A167CKP3_9ASCO|nr:trifunctional dihydropteroate synthetase/dihydrohydroxymethylpterin pyrophosphokinase/dihydroneopterin aldolase FOL1 [Sugiyamaella lignohabitans]ANB11819.1 trifunctional dihydropteroate synthetase/dihydrohydroxymethylpterin pyrophosphokinase/dihydroneopterin aldolase FOL1 [Sugiyamaella lignohabitans]